jgi:hypothetical protein
MDRVGLEILRGELARDAQVIHHAAETAQARFSQDVPGHLEACGFELHRLYNTLEKAFERICGAFETHFERRGDFPERLIERMALAVNGVRPAFLPEEHWDLVRELKGFRHLFRHAYDLKLRADRLRELVAAAAEVAAAFPRWSDVFFAQVMEEQGWDASES